MRSRREAALESAKAQVTAIPWVDDSQCHVCRTCVAQAVCRSKALVRLDRDESPFVDAGRCYGHQICIAWCPHEAIRKALAYLPVDS